MPGVGDHGSIALATIATEHTATFSGMGILPMGEADIGRPIAFGISHPAGPPNI